MVPRPLDMDVVTERAAWVREMVARIRTLPLQDETEFLSDFRNVATAESCLRRAIEALLDLGRHILTRAFACATRDYKEVGTRLREHGVLDAAQESRMRGFAGYRNRLVHFYNEVTPHELYETCNLHLDEIDTLLVALTSWVNRNTPSELERHHGPGTAGQ